MVELFAALLPETPRLVKPRYDALPHRNSPRSQRCTVRLAADLGPVDGIFTRFACDGLMQQMHIRSFRVARLQGAYRIECQDYSFASVLLRYKCSMHQRTDYSDKPPSIRTNTSRRVRRYGQVA
jgi:hypothetical protein